MEPRPDKKFGDKHMKPVEEVMSGILKSRSSHGQKCNAENLE
jgi:hypothetical protein